MYTQHHLAAGMRFGRLTALSQHHKDTRLNWFWLCQCDCGNKKVVSRSHLVAGSTQSCGCLMRETRRGRLITHGLSKTRFYHIWSGMYCRCHKTYHGAFWRYGGRGITVYAKWHTFQGFVDDMYDSYKKHCEQFGEQDTSIDRIDGTKGYYPGNVRWATCKEQANNMITNIHRRTITDIDGHAIRLVDFLKKYHLKYNQYTYRLSRGYSLRNIAFGQKEPRLKVTAFREPLERYFRHFVFLNNRERQILKARYGLFGEQEQTLSELSTLFKISRERVRQIESRAMDRILNS